MFVSCTHETEQVHLVLETSLPNKQWLFLHPCCACYSVSSCLTGTLQSSDFADFMQDNSKPFTLVHGDWQDVPISRAIHTIRMWPMRAKAPWVHMYHGVYTALEEVSSKPAVGFFGKDSVCCCYCCWHSAQWTCDTESHLVSLGG